MPTLAVVEALTRRGCDPLGAIPIPILPDCMVPVAVMFPVELMLNTVVGVLVWTSNKSALWLAAPLINPPMLLAFADWMAKLAVCTDVPFWT